MKKALGKIFFAAMLAATLSASMVGTAAADENGVLGYVSADFEKFDVGQTFTSDPESGVISIEAANDLTYEIVDDNGDKVMKITRAAKGQNNFGIKLIPAADALADANYWVVKYDLKNGDTYPFTDYNGATFGNEFPYINQQLQFRNDGESIVFAGTRSLFKAYEWHEFIFIGNPKTGNVRLILDGKDMGETNCDRIGSVSEFFGIQLYDVNSGRPYEHVMYVDDMEIFGFDYDVSCELDGLDTVVSSDTIELTAKGYVDADTFDGITISSEKDTEIAITDRTYDEQSGIITLKLSHAMADFTTYTLDYSSVKCKIPAIAGGKSSATFKTTGQIDTECELTANGKDTLVSGMNDISFTVRNITDTPAPLCLITELVENGKTTAMSYKNVTLNYNEQSSINAFFKPTSDDAKVVAYVKNAVNGTIFYSDVYTVTATATAAAPAENISEKYPVVSTDEQKGFYALTLGADGNREKAEKLTSAGLIDVTADVGTDENLLIAAVKKDGKLVNIAYTKGSGIMHTAVFADKDCRVEMYVWSDIFGTGGKGEKAALAAK